MTRRKLLLAAVASFVLLGSPAEVFARRECLVTVTVYKSGGSDCSTRCDLYDDATGEYTGYIEYGWC